MSDVPLFNADFYVAAATVIPVLFIALMFPGGLLHRYALWTKRWRSKQVIPALRRDREWRQAQTNPLKRFVGGKQMWARMWVYRLLSLPITVVVLAGCVGEICAVIALDRRHATSLEHFYVLKSMYALPVIAALSAGAAISQAYAKSIGDGRPDAEGPKVGEPE